MYLFCITKSSDHSKFIFGLATLNDQNSVSGFQGLSGFLLFGPLLQKSRVRAASTNVNGELQLLQQGDAQHEISFQGQ